MTLNSVYRTQAHWRTTGALVLACAAAAAASAQQTSETTAAKQDLAPEEKLIVNVVDLTGLADIDSDFIRKNLLENAFDRAAEDKEWLGKYEFRYNYGVPDDRGGCLEFNVVEWERSAANVYEATLTGKFRPVAGETINLGTVTGRKSGLNVSTGWDVTDHFIEAAEAAFEQALDALAEKRGVN